MNALRKIEPLDRNCFFQTVEMKFKLVIASDMTFHCRVVTKILYYCNIFNYKASHQLSFTTLSSTRKIFVLVHENEGFSGAAIWILHSNT